MYADIMTIFKKEFAAYFRSRLGYFVLIIYALMVTIGTFFGTKFLAQTNSSLSTFFSMASEIMLLIIPAITMKLWTDEQRQNTLELLLAQPIAISSMAVGKFLAAWALCGLLLLSNVGIWVSCGIILPLDHLGVFINIFACLLFAGALCAICSAVSALTSHAVSSYIVSLMVCLLLKSVSLDALLQKAKISNEIITRASQVFNFDQHFTNMISGQLTLAGLLYYLSFIGLSLWFTIAAVEYKRS